MGRHKKQKKALFKIFQVMEFSAWKILVIRSASRGGGTIAKGSSGYAAEGSSIW